MNTKSDREAEERFLAGLEAEPMPVDPMIGLLRDLAGAGEIERVEGWAELMADALAGRRDRAGLCRLLAVRRTWYPDPAGFRDLCRRTLLQAGGDRLGRALVESAGFDSDLPVEECLRRYGVLLALQPGVPCLDGTWGFGVVQAADALYGRFTIDFENRPAHQMAFAYAAQTLAVPGDDHLMVRKHRDPAGVAALADENPAELIRVALRSYGPMSAAELKNRLVDALVPESGWKAFWDAARPALKADPLVEVPARRSEPLRLRASAREFGDAWLAGLRGERDPEQILAGIEEWEAECGAAGLGDEWKEALGERLAFVAWAAGDRRPELAARAVLAAARLGCPAQAIDVPALTRRLLEPEALLAAASGLRARELPRFLAHLVEIEGEPALRTFLDLLPGMPFNVLSEAIELLTAAGREQDCAARLRALAASHEEGLQILYWLCRRTDRTADWTILPFAELFGRVLDALGRSRDTVPLRMRNQFLALLQNGEWLKDLLGRLDGDQRAALLRRVRAARGWDVRDQRAVMGGMIRLDPDLERVAAAEPEAGASAPAAKAARVTSWRSYRERQEQLRKLVEQDIPRNSREIGRARSYGDLSENFEYQAAKDQQKLLGRRKAELEQALREVRGTDFPGACDGTVAAGVRVRIERPGGQQVAYCVLGEWDSDAALGIIPNRSAVAERLAGARAGDEVVLPGPAGDERCRVVEVTGLPAAVRAWVTGRAAEGMERTSPRGEG